MRSYDEYCAVAKSLDVIGDRWTLLIVRELALRGACRYTDVRNGLPGIASNLLAERLRELEHAGVIAREDAPPPIAQTRRSPDHPNRSSDSCSACSNPPTPQQTESTTKATRPSWIGSAHKPSSTPRRAESNEHREARDRAASDVRGVQRPGHRGRVASDDRGRGLAKRMGRRTCPRS